MSKLRPPRLGPIVGHITEDGARIWIRAGDSEDSGGIVAPHRRTIGVAAICEEGKRFTRKRVHYFRLHREYDRTGTFTFGFQTGIGDDDESEKLKADTRYQVRVGVLTIDDPDPDGERIGQTELGERLPDAGVWMSELKLLDEAVSLATFRTAPAAGEVRDSFTFLLGSCRYPGLLWKAKNADKIFGPMYEEAMGRDGRIEAQLVLMVGDQIYADKLNRFALGLADTSAEFQERYISAFGSRRMRKLLRSVPTYMILDDHEIEDNWSQDRMHARDSQERERSRALFNMAIEAYRSYQWLHSPKNYGKRLFYSFDHSGYPFFVLDTRTQRYMADIDDELSDNHLLGRPSLSEEEPSQLDFLLHWLKQQQDERGDVPKFIVSASVFAPNPIDAREGRKSDKQSQLAKWKEASDSWPAFPTTRRSLLAHIVNEEIQNVVFLSGDIHVSNVAQLEFSGSPQASALRACSVTSSAFYWPFPFADGEPGSYVHDSRAEGQEDTFEIRDGVQLNYKAYNFTQEDNFCRLDIDRERHRLVVIPYGKRGEQLQAGGFLGIGARPLMAELELASW